MVVVVVLLLLTALAVLVLGRENISAGGRGAPIDSQYMLIYYGIIIVRPRRVVAPHGCCCRTALLECLLDPSACWYPVTPAEAGD